MILDLLRYVPKENLSAIRILEPSCGHGSFAIEIVKRIITSIQQWHTKLSDFEESVRFCDIDSNALDICRQKIEKLFFEAGFNKNEASNAIDKWFVSGDFLDLNMPKFDIVVGNPPYIKATFLNVEARKHYISILKTFSMGTDLYIGFIEKGLALLKPHGSLAFICSDRWQHNQYGKRLREYISNGFCVSFNCEMHDVEAFETKVTAYPSITIIKKDRTDKVSLKCSSSFDEVSASKLVSEYLNGHPLTDCESYKVINEKPNEISLPVLEEAGLKIGIGIATGADKIFLVSNDSIVEKDRLLPIAYSKDIQNGKLPKNPIKWLVNPWDDSGNLVSLDDYPMLKEYFLANFEVLCKRHVAKNSSGKWFRTIDKVTPGLKAKKKLLIRDMGKTIHPIFDAGVYYPHHNFYWITSDTWDLRVLGGILISDFAFNQLKNISVDMRGGVVRSQAQYLRKIRVPRYEDISFDEREALIDVFERMDVSKASALVERIVVR